MHTTACIARSLVLSSFLVSIAVSTSTFEKDVFGSLFETSRILQEAPQEGISLLSGGGQEAFLLDGETDDVIFSYIFMPPSGIPPNQYELTFGCDSLAIYDSEQCSVNNAVTQIIGSDATAYNTTVSCMFAQFPGTMLCELSASPIATSARAVSISHDQNLSLSGMKSGMVRQTALATYTSPKTKVSVYGIVLFTPDTSGQASVGAKIMSGGSNSYQQAEFDRTSQGVREISISAFVPGLGAVTGSSAVDLMKTATISTAVEDQILKYDPSTCLLENAAFVDGTLSLPSPDSCSIGVASAGETSNAKMGFQFRPYKSGKFVLKMSWTVLGTNADSYEQSLSLQILEAAPPVFVDVQKDEVYKSVPCGSQKLTIVAYNVRFAETRTLSVANADGTTGIWSEIANSFSYDASLDQSSMDFESPGGSGSAAPITLQAIFGTETRLGVVITSGVDATVSFSTPPGLTAISPDMSSVGGRELVVLTGSFESFGTDGVVRVGGFIVPKEDVTVVSTTQISFKTPALSALGSSYVYEVSVGVCAERSSTLKLSYTVSPAVSITAIGTGVDETGSYIIPPSGTASFLAAVSGNNVGIEYTWEVLTSGEDAVGTGDLTTDSQVFNLASTVLTSSSEVYKVVCKVQNSLGLTDSANITAKLSQEGASLLTVMVYDVEDISRSTDTVTLVQSSIQFVEDPNSETNLADSTLVIEWTYNGQTYRSDDSTADSEITGPTQFGLEFNIARKDLIVGEQVLTLSVYISENPDIRGSADVKIRVLPSALQPVINGGVNGTLILEGNDLVLNAADSFDPDILEGEGDSSSGLEYEWTSCRKSLTPSFSFGTESCQDILPSSTSTSEISIPAASLSNARLDNSMEGDPTYFSFGLVVRKGKRSAEAYSFLEVRTVADTEPIPLLASLEVVDIKGVALREASIFSDIIIQPTSSDSSVKWAFDMSRPSQRYFFSQNGIFKSGAGFVTSNRIQSRDRLGFRAGALQPSTEYTVKVTTSAADTSLESEYEVSFRTADVPTLTCIPPEVRTGTIFESKFVISAQLTFEDQSIEYCFNLLSSSPARKYSVGKGCSSVPFAEFSFPMAGTFGIQCIARTITGAVIDTITLDTNLVLTNPTPPRDSTAIQTLFNRLAAVEAQLDDCVLLKDHACIELFIASAASFLRDVELAVEGDTSEEGQALTDAAKEYMTRLSQLSETLADQTVYRPNQIEESIDQTFFMAQISGSFVESESTLFGFLAPVENAVTSTQGDSAQPIISNELVEKVSGTANLTLTTALNIAQEGTSRRRLRNEVDSAHRSFAAVLHTVTRLVGRIRAQQESCGYSGSESTAFPGSMETAGRAGETSSGPDIAPLEIGIKIPCTRTQVEGELQRSKVSLEVCEAALGASEIRRLVFMLVPIPDALIDATGLQTNVASYIDELAYLETQGMELGSLPEQCLRVIMKRKESTVSNDGFENLVAGLLQNLPTTTSNCTTKGCYAFEETDDVTFGEQEVVIQTNKEGLFIAGNLTGRVAAPEFGSVDGVGLGLGGQVIRAVGAGMAFIVGAVLVTWLATSSFRIASAPESSTGAAQPKPLVDTQWEYCERDLFARESHKKDGSQASLSGAHKMIPEGASPPEAEPNPKT